jgi:hypothetical protein
MQLLRQLFSCRLGLGIGVVGLEQALAFPGHGSTPIKPLAVLIGMNFGPHLAPILDFDGKLHGLAAALGFG